MLKKHTAYFDNAATSYPKPECVYEYMDDFYRRNGGSAGRGQYRLSQSAKEIIDDTRYRIKSLLHCSSKQVVFEPSATIALNIIVQGIIKRGAKNVYISPFEHNAVTRTLHHYEKDGAIRVVQLAVSDNLVYDIQRIKYQFDDCAPDFVIVSHASNVIGLIAPVIEIFTLAKSYGAITLVDMAQTAGLVDCNIGLDIFDFAVFAGHKTLYGPTGISGFAMKEEIDLSPVIFGGTGYDSANQDMPINIPERYEVGTLNIAGIAGLNSALRWIDEKSIAFLRNEEDERRTRLIQLINQYDYSEVIGNVCGLDYVGIVSCRFNGLSSDVAGGVLGEHGVSVRSGLQCAPLAHKFLKTFPTGTIRFSISSLTNEDDFLTLDKVLNQLSKDL